MDEERYPSIYKGGKTYCRIMIGADCRPAKRLKVTLEDVARYYAFEARNITSGCRTLAGWSSDWREVNGLASECLEYFKEVNVVGMRKAVKPYKFMRANF